MLASKLKRHCLNLFCSNNHVCKIFICGIATNTISGGKWTLCFVRVFLSGSNHDTCAIQNNFFILEGTFNCHISDQNHGLLRWDVNWTIRRPIQYWHMDKTYTALSFIAWRSTPTSVHCAASKHASTRRSPYMCPLTAP